MLAAACFEHSSARGATADWNGYASIASNYMFRGVALLDSGPSLRTGAEGRLNDTFVVGAWAANIDHEWLYDSDVSRHVELNLYGGVDFGCGGDCRARLIVADYVFPGTGARDWQEATASIAFAGRIGASLSYSPHGFGSDTSTHTVEAWVVQPLTRNMSVSCDAGKVWLGSRDYWYARSGVSRRLGRWVVELSRYWSDPKYRRYGFDDRSKRLVLSLSTAF